jgi:hypothetical protein
MQAEMDRSIAANAENETLYDQPEREQDQAAHHRPVHGGGRALPDRASTGGAAEGASIGQRQEDQIWQI